VTKDQLRAEIEKAGGLTTLSRYARERHVSKQRLQTLSKHPHFPAPFFVEGRIALYLVAELDTFRATRRPSGRPRKKESGSG
jgi:hypothetical protein